VDCFILTCMQADFNDFVSQRPFNLLKAVLIGII
jgi:hypothetical protein